MESIHPAIAFGKRKSASGKRDGFVEQLSTEMTRQTRTPASLDGFGLQAEIFLFFQSTSLWLNQILTFFACGAAKMTSNGYCEGVRL